MSHFLTILEVSQKQAYIFSSNMLKDNVVNSAVIAWIMSPKYFSEVIGDRNIFDEEKNVVYSGGGHVVLEFADRGIAKDFVKHITFQIHHDYPGIEVFSVTKEFTQEELNTEAGNCLKKLTAELEKKKSVRLSSFHQGSFGIETIDSNTLKPRLAGKYLGSEMPDDEREIEKRLAPDNYKLVDKFKELGGSKDESNFISVVHIDGNAMGARVERMYENNKLPWEAFKVHLQAFSKAIDKDFKDAYKEMTDQVRKNIESGRLADLSLKEKNFPVRRIITAGDDICFVSEGRIGIECAVSFIKALTKKENEEDKEGYAACAGIAIVHQKYPFYRAYELAESLCSNAKKFGVKWSDDETGSEISAIDWHVEFGEMGDTLSEIRQQYCAADGNRLEMRPYIVKVNQIKDVSGKEKEPSCKEISNDIPWYSEFKSQVERIQKREFIDARGKMKELRNVLKQGQEATKAFIQFNKMEDVMLSGMQKNMTDHNKVGTGQAQKRELYPAMRNGLKDERTTVRSAIFDALEIFDTYIGFEEDAQ